MIEGQWKIEKIYFVGVFHYKRWNFFTNPESIFLLIPPEDELTEEFLARIRPELLWVSFKDHVGYIKPTKLIENMDYHTGIARVGKKEAFAVGRLDGHGKSTEILPNVSRLQNEGY